MYFTSFILERCEINLRWYYVTYYILLYILQYGVTDKDLHSVINVYITGLSNCLYGTGHLCNLSYATRSITLFNLVALDVFIPIRCYAPCNRRLAGRRPFLLVNVVRILSLIFTDNKSCDDRLLSYYLPRRISIIGVWLLEIMIVCIIKIVRVATDFISLYYEIYS